MKNISFEEFVKKSTETHKGFYDYSLVNCINFKIKKTVTIICPKHGKFNQLPINHKDGAKCRFCSFEIKRGRNHKKSKGIYNFLKDAKKIHGDLYDYSKVLYENGKTKVQIICKTHGIFEQTPGGHLNGNGCPQCANNINLTTKEFINKSISIHGNLYNYCKANYIKSYIPVELICKKHGSFFQAPYNYKHKCPKCAKEYKFSNIDKFISKSISKHGELYNYSKSIYKNSREKLEIICRKHGSFFQAPCSHLQGRGCPRCKRSYGENEIYLFLSQSNISYKEQYTFSNCKNKYILRFDFYLPDFNTCIEFDGVQHFKSTKFFGGNIGLKNIQKCDKIKNIFCKENNIELIRISDKNSIKKLLSKFLK